MSLIMVCDTETSDLPKYELPKGDPTQPWIVSAAAQLCSDDGKMIDHFSSRVLANGRHIRPGAEAVHGITTRSAGRFGISELTVLGVIIGFASQATIVTGFGLEFDRWIIESNLLRLNKDTRMWVRPGLEFVDLMKACAPVCRIPSGRSDGQFKWPTLDEACEIILGMPPREGDHIVWDDTERARLLYFALRERKILETAA